MRDATNRLPIVIALNCTIVVAVAAAAAAVAVAAAARLARCGAAYPLALLISE